MITWNIRRPRRRNEAGEDAWRLAWFLARKPRRQGTGDGRRCFTWYD